MNVFHYTVLGNLKLIIDSELRPSAIEMEVQKIPHRPILWFSRQTTYDRTALKAIPHLKRCADDFEELCQYYTAVRITVPEELAPITWGGFLKTSGICSSSYGRKYAKGLEDAALLMGSNVNFFRGSYTPISRNEFSAVEVWSKSQWLP